jgi:hypothetical protein
MYLSKGRCLLILMDNIWLKTHRILSILIVLIKVWVINKKKKCLYIFSFRWIFQFITKVTFQSDNNCIHNMNFIFTKLDLYLDRVHVKTYSEKKKKVAALWLVYQATEAMLNHKHWTRCTKTFRSFDITIKLWEKNTHELPSVATYRFFTIQMPHGPVSTLDRSSLLLMQL